MLLLPWTGFAADHFNQCRLLMMTQAAMGVLALAPGVLTVSGLAQLWHVDAFAFGHRSAFGNSGAPRFQPIIPPAMSDPVFLRVRTISIVKSMRLILQSPVATATTPHHPHRLNSAAPPDDPIAPQRKMAVM